MGKDNLSGKKKYTNGNISKFFYPGQEPNGWYLGCTDAYREKQSKATVENWKKDAYRDKQKKRDPLWDLSENYFLYSSKNVITLSGSSFAHMHSQSTNILIVKSDKS